MLPEIADAEEKLKQAKEERDRVIAKCHAKCKHPIESCYEASHTECSPPFRVCTACGYAEEGWGCGYWKLNYSYKDVQSISRKDANKYIKKFWDQEMLSEAQTTPAQKAAMDEINAKYHRNTGR